LHSPESFNWWRPNRRASRHRRKQRLKKTGNVGKRGGRKAPIPSDHAFQQAHAKADGKIYSKKSIFPNRLKVVWFKPLRQ